MIYGKKTRLRRMERKDIPTFVRWLNDPEVREFLTMYRPFSMAEEEKWFERQLQGQESEIFAIEALDGVLIGSVALHNINWQCRHVELAIVIGEKEYWGKGYGSDAISALLRFVFDEMNLHRVFLQVRDDNARAIRAYEKCGFQHEGRMRETIYSGGRYYDELCMGVLRHEFDANQVPA
jgi:RimJ/RimL family protein N-acetyltransferase